MNPCGLSIATRRILDAAAYDATIGSGNFPEYVSVSVAEKALGRTLSLTEMTYFENEWRRALQAAEQP